MYYKVVSNMKSVSVVSANMEVTYKVGEWVEPRLKGSKLFVFNSLEAARNFSKGYSSYEIYECEVEGVYKGKYKLFARILNKRALWKAFFNKKKFVNLLGNPNGSRVQKALENTAWVDRVKLLRKV